MEFLKKWEPQIYELSSSPLYIQMTSSDHFLQVSAIFRQTRRTETISSSIDPKLAGG